MNEEKYIFDDPLSKYKNILSGVTKDLNEYSDIELCPTKTLDSKMVEFVAESLSSLSQTISNDIQKSAEKIMTCEDIANWMSAAIFHKFGESGVLSDDLEGFDTSQGEFSVELSNTCMQLRSLRNDLVEKLRNIIDNNKSPDIQRLSSLKDSVECSLNMRRTVLEQLNEECKNANFKYEKSKREKEAFIREMEDAEDQLEMLMSDDSFNFVQQARKHEIIDREWVIRISDLYDKIESVQKDIENMKNPDQFIIELRKTNNNQENEFNKASTQYKTDIALISRELTEVTSMNKALTDAMLKENRKTRSRMLDEEKKLAKSVLNKSKINNESFMKKYKKERSTRNRALDKSLKRKESDPFATILEDHNADTKELSDIFERYLAELTEIVNDRKQSIVDLYDFKRNILKNETENKKNILSASKERIKERLKERDVELKSIEKQLLPMENLRSDLVRLYNKRINEKKDNTGKINDIKKKNESIGRQYNEEIDVYNKFIRRARIITIKLRRLIKRKAGMDDFYNFGEEEEEKTEEISKNENNEEEEIEKEIEIEEEEIKEQQTREIEEEISDMKVEEEEQHYEEENQMNEEECQINKEEEELHENEEELHNNEEEETRNDEEETKNSEEENQINEEESINQNTSENKIDDEEKDYGINPLFKDYSVIKEPIKTNEIPIKEKEEKKEKQQNEKDENSQRNEIKQKLEKLISQNEKKEVIKKVVQKPRATITIKEKVFGSKQTQEVKISESFKPKQPEKKESIRKGLWKSTGNHFNSLPQSKVRVHPITPMNSLSAKKEKVIIRDKKTNQKWKCYDENDPFFFSVEHLLTPSSRSEAYEFRMRGDEAKLRRSVKKGRYRFVLKSSSLGTDKKKHIKVKKKSSAK